MSSLLWEWRGRLWIAALQSILLKCQAYLGWWRRREVPDQLVVEVANDLSVTMQIWVIDDEPQTRGHIASSHRLMEIYRDHLLCSNSAGHTFLIDMQTRTYLKGSATQHLLQIDGVEQARRFVDELCLRLQMVQE
jgi:hypothetical protein